MTRDEVSAAFASLIAGATTPEKVKTVLRLIEEDRTLRAQVEELSIQNARLEGALGGSKGIEDRI